MRELPKEWWPRFLRGEVGMGYPHTESSNRRFRAFVERLTFQVPIYILELKAMGGPNYLHWVQAHMMGRQIAAKGDVLQFEHGPEREELFRILSQGLAILAFCPGGVTFCGQHWEATAAPMKPQRFRGRAGHRLHKQRKRRL